MKISFYQASRQRLNYQCERLGADLCSLTFALTKVGNTRNRQLSKSLTGGNVTFIYWFDKTKFSCFSLPLMQHQSFFRKYKICLVSKNV